MLNSSNKAKQNAMFDYSVDFKKVFHKFEIIMKINNY